MNNYSIKDLEHLSGIKAHTLRIWEQRYNIISPKRTQTNIRFYDDSDLKLVLNIALLNQHGFKISKIAKMSEEALRKEVMCITEKSLKYPDQIQALTLAMIDLDEERFEKIIATNTLQLGFERTMIHIIYPFLIRIGFLWQTGAICPAQEHFISSLIRQKIIVAIDGQVPVYPAYSSKYLLFLPAGEMHELSLLFANYIIKSRNHKVIYLGQNLPFVDLQQAYNQHLPDYILTIITSQPAQAEVQDFVNRLLHCFSEAKILLSGYQVVGQDLEIPNKVLIINKIEDLIEFVEEND